MAQQCRRLSAADVEEAAQVIAHAFVDDPLFSYMLPRERTRVRTLVKFFRAYGTISIKNGRGFGTGEPLQGVAYWESPGQASLSISVRSLGSLLPLLFTRYPIGYFRARTVMKRIDELRQK